MPDYYDRILHNGLLYPYHWNGEGKAPKPIDAAEYAAIGVFNDLSDRSGWTFDDLDDEIKEEIFKTSSAIIRRAFETFNPPEEQLKDLGYRTDKFHVGHVVKLKPESDGYLPYTLRHIKDEWLVVKTVKDLEKEAYKAVLHTQHITFMDKNDTEYFASGYWLEVV